MTNKTQAVIFDLDGVIVDTEPLNKQCLREFLIDLGAKDPQPLSVNLQGLNSKAYWTALKTGYNLSQPLEELMVRWRETYLSFLAALDEIPIIPGIPELIDFLVSANYLLAIASAANAARIKLTLDKIKLEHSFSVIVDGDSYENSKPAPDCFLLAARRLSVSPEECIVIEDSTNGVGAAKAANMRCIGYAGSDHNDDDLSQADVIIKDFKSLTKSLAAGEPFPL
jgi:beta-phosphoglucomutase-like phosphatase (HAD superfamily)